MVHIYVNGAPLIFVCLFVFLNWTNFFGGEHQTNILFPFYSWITISFLPIWIVPFPMLFFIPSKFSTFIHSNLLSFYLVWIIELYIRMTVYETKKKFRFLNSRSSFDYHNVHGKKFLFFLSIAQTRIYQMNELNWIEIGK